MIDGLRDRFYGSANSTGGLVASNAVTAIASGPEANVLAIAANMVVQWIKEYDWFDQRRWAIPTLILLGLVIGAVLWRDDLHKLLVGGLNIAGQAWSNYRTLSPNPVMPAAGDVEWTGSSFIPSPLVYQSPSESSGSLSETPKTDRFKGLKG